MNQGKTNPNSLIDTTDCLEAVGVFRGWKNFFFTITILSLLLLQAGFWSVEIGLIKTDQTQQQTNQEAQVAANPSVNVSDSNSSPVKAAVIADSIKVAAIEAVSDSNTPAKSGKTLEELKSDLLANVTFENLSWLIRICNFILVPTAILYCLTLLFGLKVSLLGRLGGINHIARAFFLSLLMVVVLLPWQKVFPDVFIGAMYTPNELLAAAGDADKGILAQVLHYGRFCGTWVIVVLLLIFAQIRSGRWANAMLRRLEIV